MNLFLFYVALIVCNEKPINLLFKIARENLKQLLWISGESIIIPDFTISVYGRLCDLIFFGLILALFTGIPAFGIPVRK